MQDRCAVQLPDRNQDTRRKEPFGKSTWKTCVVKNRYSRILSALSDRANLVLPIREDSAVFVLKGPSLYSHNTGDPTHQERCNTDDNGKDKHWVNTEPIQITDSVLVLFKGLAHFH